MLTLEIGLLVLRNVTFSCSKFAWRNFISDRELRSSSFCVSRALLDSISLNSEKKIIGIIFQEFFYSNVRVNKSMSNLYLLKNFFHLSKRVLFVLQHIFKFRDLAGLCINLFRKYRYFHV